MRQLVALGVVEGGEVGDVAVRRQVHLDRPARGGRHVRRPVLAAQHDPGARPRRSASRTSAQQVAAGAPRGALGACRSSCARARRHERVGVDLAVRVVQRDADLAAAVLEAEHLLDAGQRRTARAVRSAQASMTVRARCGVERGERRVVVGGEADDLAAADARGATGTAVRRRCRPARPTAVMREATGTGSRTPRRRSRAAGISLGTAPAAGRAQRALVRAAAGTCAVLRCEAMVTHSPVSTSKRSWERPRIGRLERPGVRVARVAGPETYGSVSSK